MSNIIMIPSCPALKFKIENLILGPVSSKVLSFRLNFSINSRPAFVRFCSPSHYVRLYFNKIFTLCMAPQIVRDFLSKYISVFSALTKNRPKNKILLNLIYIICVWTMDMRNLLIFTKHSLRFLNDLWRFVEFRWIVSLIMHVN